ncbi:MAG TPA: ATP-dependent DNA ligase [Vicinamibacterales bacterium]
MAKKQSRVDSAVPAETVAQAFPALDLPITPPYPPMEARSATAIPSGSHWIYEPKWDGFRCLAFRDGRTVALQSKSGQALHRYFPELVETLLAVKPARFVIDGEIVITRDGHLFFDDLLQRIHPAASRIKKLAADTPATLLVFDILVDGRGRDVSTEPLEQRRTILDAFFKSLGGAHPMIDISPFTHDHAQAEQWIRELGRAGLDGVIAKRANEPYHSGDRDAMVKVKRLRTADCVVGGFRYGEGTKQIGSLLLGLYNRDGELDHVGFSSSFAASERAELKKVVEPLAGGEGFTGKAPGGPSRWATKRSSEWVPLEPSLVCEVRYDHFSGGRFRHGTKFLRWRPDKKPKQCTFEQVK